MATFTSVTSGNWNDGATWGKTSPGVKGVDWPGNAGDVVNIGTTANQSHVVIYNVSETNELGAVTIGATSGTGASRLDFATGVNTKLTISHNDIVVNKTGELRVGVSGAIIPGNYYAELIWNTTADLAKGINLVTGGSSTFNTAGDPAFYGSVPWGALYQDWSAPGSGASTIYVTGDVTGWFNAGYSYLYNDPELAIHKGQAYASVNNDFCRVRITGAITYDGTKSTIPVTILEIPGGAASFKAGGDVLNLSRNVRFAKLSAAVTIGGQNTNRPRVNNANAATTQLINMFDAAFVGFYQAVSSYGCYGTGLVLRNGCYPLNTVHLSDITAIIFANYGGASGSSSTNIRGKIANCSYAGVSSGWNNKIYADIFGCSGNGAMGVGATLFGNIYSCLLGIGGSAEEFIVVGQLGYDLAGIAKPNTNDFGFNTNYLSATVINAKIQDPPTFTNANAIPYRGRVRFEHYLQQQGAHCIFDAFGSIVKTPADGTGDNPTLRLGGNTDILEVIPYSNCGSVSPLSVAPLITSVDVLDVRLWATAGVSKTYRFYIQTDFAALLPAALKLYGEYLDQGGGGHLATVSSTQDIATRSDASDWSQYVEVTINPAQTGYVNLYMRLMGYESGKKVWVDPKPEGVAMTPRWSYGEVVLEPITASGGGSVSPTNLGLVPLGIKQVAI